MNKQYCMLKIHKVFEDNDYRCPLCDSWNEDCQIHNIEYKNETEHINNGFFACEKCINIMLSYFNTKARVPEDGYSIRKEKNEKKKNEREEKRIQDWILLRKTLYDNRSDIIKLWKKFRLNYLKRCLKLIEIEMEEITQ